MKTSWFVAVLSIVGFDSLVAWSHDATPRSSTTIDSVVQNAYRAEASGDLDTRRTVLNSIDSNASHSALQWMRGNVRDATGKWNSVDDSIVNFKQNRLLEEYESKRSMAPDTVDGQLALARWCEGKKLDEQRLVHLERVLRLEPENALARQLLGYRRIGWDWLSADEIRVAEERAKRIKASILEYGPAMRSIARDLSSEKPTVIANAEKSLATHDDPLAIPALEAAFTNGSNRALEAGLQWLGKHSAPEASQALMRFAIFHPSSFVQQLAGGYLAKRDFYEFAPQMMELVASPVHASMQPVYQANGNLRGFQQAFYREGLEQDQILVVETTINGVRGRSVNGRANVEVLGVGRPQNFGTAQAASAAIQRTRDTFDEREGKIELRNERVRKLNTRVSDLISQLAGASIPPDPKALWSWWNEYNETERPLQRTSRYVRYYEESNYQIQSTPTLALGGECLVKGTPVTTHRGLKPIDKIVAGDLVLSKQIKTGALEWKPVLEATRRPPTTLLAITAGTDTLTCTPGHVFWISGKGWRKASQLVPGDVFHSAKLPIAIDKISDADRAATFNLIVADHANYFVGAQAILSHDFTSRTFTPETIPGYVPVQETK